MMKNDRQKTVITKRQSLTVLNMAAQMALDTGAAADNPNLQRHIKAITKHVHAGKVLTIKKE